ncbi:MAG: nuclear transport factor 2 family protein [Acidimicrobiales bacterium]
MRADQAVISANREYYDAFEGRDLDAMSALWERSARAVCTHPGWSTLRGWGPIASSYFSLFQQPEHLQFVLTEERAVLSGDTAWISVDENLLGQVQGGVTIATLNIFVRQDSGEWRMVCHHGSVVASALVEGAPEGP